MEEFFIRFMIYDLWLCREYYYLLYPMQILFSKNDITSDVIKKIIRCDDFHTDHLCESLWTEKYLLLQHPHIFFIRDFHKFFPSIIIQFNYRLLVLLYFVFHVSIHFESDNLTKYVYEFHYLQIVMTRKFFQRARVTRFTKRVNIMIVL